MEQNKDNKFLATSIVIAAVILGGSIVFQALHSGAPSGQPSAGAGNQKPAPTVDVSKLGSRDAILGSPSAPVTLIEYGDYQCPFCAKYFSEVEPQLMAQYISTGKVRMIFRNFAFLGAESTAAAQAAECAQDQNKLWAYHDALYSAKLGDYNNGGKEGDGFFTRALFLQIALHAQMNVSAFTTCIDTNKNAALVKQEYTDAQGAGVNSTPATFINGTLVTDANGSSVGANTQAILQAVAKAVR